MRIAVKIATSMHPVIHNFRRFAQRVGALALLAWRGRKALLDSIMGAIEAEHFCYLPHSGHFFARLSQGIATGSLVGRIVDGSPRI